VAALQSTRGFGLQGFVRSHFLDEQVLKCSSVLMPTCPQHVTARLTRVRGLAPGVLKDHCVMTRYAVTTAQCEELTHETRSTGHGGSQIKTLPRVIAGWTRQGGWCILRRLGILRRSSRLGVRWRVNPPAATPDCFSQVWAPGNNSRKAASACVSFGVSPCPVPCTELRSQTRKISLPARMSASTRGTICRSARLHRLGCRVPPRAPRPKSAWPIS